MDFWPGCSFAGLSSLSCAHFPWLFPNFHWQSFSGSCRLRAWARCPLAKTETLNCALTCLVTFGCLSLALPAHLDLLPSFLVILPCSGVDLCPRLTVPLRWCLLLVRQIPYLFQLLWISILLRGLSKPETQSCGVSKLARTTCSGTPRGCVVRLCLVLIASLGLGLQGSGQEQFRIRGLAVPTELQQLTCVPGSTLCLRQKVLESPPFSNLQPATGVASVPLRTPIRSPRASPVKLRRASTCRVQESQTFALPLEIRNGVFRGCFSRVSGVLASRCGALPTRLAWCRFRWSFRGGHFGCRSACRWFSWSGARWIYSRRSLECRKFSKPAWSCRSFGCFGCSQCSVGGGVACPYWSGNAGPGRGFLRVSSESGSSSRSLGGGGLFLRCRSTVLHSSSSDSLDQGSRMGSWRRRGFGSRVLHCRQYRWRGAGRRRDGWASGGGDTTPGSKKKTHCAWARTAYHARKTAHCRFSGRVFGEVAGCKFGNAETVGGFVKSSAGARAEVHQPSSPCSGPPSSLAPAYLLSIDGPASILPRCGSASWGPAQNGCTSIPGSVKIAFGEACSAWRIGGGEVSDRPIFLWRSLGSGSACSVNCFDGPGSTAGFSNGRPAFGLEHIGIDRQHQRSPRSCQAANGLSSPERCLLQCSAGFHGQKDASNSSNRWDTHGIDGQGGLWDEVSGEVWRFREASGTGLSSTSGYDNLGFPPIGKPGRSQGCSRSFGGDVGPGCIGQREVRFSAVVVPSGGTTVDSVFSQAHDHPVQSSVLQPFSRSEVGDSGLGVCERVGLDFEQAPGARVKASSLRRRRQDFRRARETKAFSKEEGQRWKGRRSTARGRGSVTGVVADEYEKVCEGQESNPLNTTMNFQTWASCLPRWILKTRTHFSRCLALSFSAVCRSNEMASATFPLPLASLDCFRGSGPGLSRRRFWILCKARLLNIWILILDFMFLGRWPTLEELRRCPNNSQHAVFDRLRTFIVACGDAQAEFNLCPGRSSPELGASLYQLERFCDVCPELATGYMEDSTIPFKQDPSLLSADLFPELVPYRSLDPSRLRLVGEGSWPMEVFMDGVLWLPFQEPRFLLHDMPVCADDQPCLDAEDPNDCLALARLWDVRGLLFLAEEPSRPGLFSRVFNCYKNHEQDRQIGDRRIVNQAELHVDGPSKHLPQGQQLTMLKLPRYTHMLRGSVTDRRDFYHQAPVTAERAMSNMLPFSYACDAFAGTAAFEKFKEKSLEHGRFDREMRGDGFRNPEEKNRRTRRKISPALPERLYPCFNSLFQGDHLGVEFALKSHMTLLEGAGLLDCSTRIKGHHAFPKGPRWDALVIDDYFALSCEPLHWSDSDTFAMHALSKARFVYEAESLLGSPEKDVVAQPVVKAAGAEIRSVEGNVRAGIVPVGAPFCKRLALAALTLRAAKLPGITPKLAARLAGNWVAILQYRKCWSSLIDSLFAFASRSDDLNQKVVLCLERSIAQELALVSAVAPLIFSNIAVDYLAQVFATDASLEKGAIVSAPIALDLCEKLWLTGDKKGAYTHLDNGFRAVLRHLGEVDDDLDAPNPKACEVSPKKPPLLYFDFVEICGGAGKVADAMVRRGHSVAPVLDLSESLHYDLTSLRLLEWIIYMLEENRFRSFLIAPPCTTFSPAAHPAVRSYKEPLGFNRCDPKTHLGNILALRSLCLLRVGKRHRRPCGIEQSRLSKMCWLSLWLSLLEAGFSEAVIASCMFGSPHRKELVQAAFLPFGLGFPWNQVLRRT